MIGISPIYSNDLGEIVMIYVVVPVYNALPYLRETIESVFIQPYKDIEIILVDDGSKDGSSLLCDDLAAENTKIHVIHQENKGVSTARNTGINYVIQRANENDFIAFLDADDLWMPNAVTDDVFKSFENDAKSDILVFTNIGCNQERTRFTNYHVREKGEYMGNVSLIWLFSDHLSAHVYRVKLLKDKSIKFIDGLKYTEDKIFQAHCIILANKICTVPKVLQIYRQNDTSAMSKVISIDPIAYYPPIIDGWLSTQDKINDNLSDKVNVGSVLAGVYLMDMALEHHKRWYRYSRIMKALKNQDSYHFLLDLNEKDVQPWRYQDKQLLLNYPVLFKVKYNVIGAFEFFARYIIKNVAFVSRLWEKRKFPVTEMPRNE